MTCPVCHRQVLTNVGGNCVATHRDKAGSPCPASGYPARICEEDL